MEKAQKVDAPADKTQLSVEQELGRAPAPWVNVSRMQVNDGMQVKLGFMEIDPVTNKATSRGAVTMSPGTAKELANLINRIVKDVEPAAKGTH